MRQWPVALLFIAAGVMHFVIPGTYVKVVPPALPWRAGLVAVSGVCEVAGGIGVLVPGLRRAAGWGLVALLVAVFPANVYMLMARMVPAWIGWGRLPLQALLIWWVWRTCCRRAA